MKQLNRNMIESHFRKLGFNHLQDNSEQNKRWQQFILAPEKGRGYISIYTEEDLFSINVFDFIINEDLSQTFSTPEFISLYLYDSVVGELTSPVKKPLKPGLTGFIGNDTVYSSRIINNTPVKGISIKIMPEYYKNYLRSRYPGEYENLSEAFESINAESDLPRLEMAMRQIGSCWAAGNSERLYLESKVAELISIIAEKNRTKTGEHGHSQIACQDRENLQSVVSYIEANLSDKIHINELSRVARMGTTKLKYSFKKVYHCTIADFIQQRRMLKAEYLLIHTEMPIYQIASELGYQDQSGFSKSFHRNLGLLPNEYRKNVSSA